MENAMNMMMPISHRLFAAAVNEGLVARKRRDAASPPAVIEVERVSRPARSGKFSARAADFGSAGLWSREKSLGL
jgi:hypothetical protein